MTGMEILVARAITLVAFVTVLVRVSSPAWATRLSQYGFDNVIIKGIIWLNSFEMFTQDSNLFH